MMADTCTLSAVAASSTLLIAVNTVKVATTMSSYTMNTS